MTTSWRSYVNEWLMSNDHNQAWLSRATGMGEAHISRLLMGQQAPMLATLLRIEKAMGVKSGTLVGLTMAEEEKKTKGGAS